MIKTKFRSSYDLWKNKYKVLVDVFDHLKGFYAGIAWCLQDS